MKRKVINSSIEIPSEKKSIKAIEPIILELKHKLKLRDDRFYNILIAVTEAVNNALIHGNKLNYDKKVFITVHSDNKYITVKVRDEGCGFDPELLADPRQPENLLKESGRGVFLIKELSDNYEYVFSGQGSELVMRFLID
jgi:serine/threonine-protein kinase RsbW